MSHRSNCVLLTMAVLMGLVPSLLGQNPPPGKKPLVGPPSPQSTHYPILLLAFGNDPNWSLRIGLKGPERLDRPSYPPIPLEPAEVTHETTADSWTYHAKDSATGAAVAVHLAREACTDAQTDTLTATPPPSGKFAFRVSVEHTQLGSLKGCARIATELFPKINNQPGEEDEEAKKKPPAPTVTNFKSPVAVAYFNATEQLVFKRGQIARVVSTRLSSGLSVSHDGKEILFTADDAPGPIRTLYEYNFDASAKHDLIHANVRDPFWSPDDKKIAFLKWENSSWSLLTIPTDNPQAASSVITGKSLELYGWPDEHTFLAGNDQSLLWVGDDGSNRQELPFQQIFGSVYRISRIDSFRLSPMNPDLLLVSFWYVPPAGEAALNKHEGDSPALLLYEIKSNRRVVLSPPGTWAELAEWSRDGLQIFFTGIDSSKGSGTYRIFWDGTGLKKYSSGTRLVIGQ
ncbi:MAG TPA: hypothetical protein VFN26_19575 [Candidatus Acidoferrum sp.]|nr:hypothetical protein [Candidatus Acidoferrum sp.]